MNDFSRNNAEAGLKSSRADGPQPGPADIYLEAIARAKKIALARAERAAGQNLGKTAPAE